MTSRRSHVFGPLWATLSALPLIASPAAAQPDTYDRAIDHGRRILSGLQRHASVPGLSVCVMIDGRIVWSEGFGWANLEQRVPVSPRTRFRIASVSKPLASAVLARLVERGEMDLDAPISRYLNDLPERIRPITLHQLAGHLGGIRHYTPDDPKDRWYGEHFETAQSAMKRYVNDALVHEPGHAFAYSTYGYSLLSAAMEGAANQSFGELLANHVTGPLRMHGTGLADPSTVTRDRTSFYVRDPDGRPVNSPPVGISYKSGGGGILSTAEDLTRFGAALLAPGLLKDETLSTLFTEMTDASGKGTGYGLGWRIAETLSGPSFYHTGGQLGAATVLSLYPDDKTVVCILSNQRLAPISPYAADIIARCFKDANSQTSPERRDAIQGRYDVTARINGQPIKGWMTLLADGESMEGHLRFSEPLPGLFLGRPRVVSVLFGPELLHLVLVDPQSGVVPLPATWQENRLSTHVEVPGLDFSLEAVKADGH